MDRLGVVQKFKIQEVIGDVREILLPEQHLHEVGGPVDNFKSKQLLEMTL